MFVLEIKQSYLINQKITRAFFFSPERSINKSSVIKENGNETQENTNEGLNTGSTTDDKAHNESNTKLLDETEVESKRKEKVTYLVSKLNEKTLNYREAMLNVSSRYESDKTRPRSRSSNR